MKKVDISFPDWIKERFSEQDLSDIESWAGRVYERLFDAVLSEKETEITALELSIAASLADELAIWLDEQLHKNYEMHLEEKGETMPSWFDSTYLKFMAVKKEIKMPKG